MDEQVHKQRFHHRRVAGHRHHVYGVELDGLRYAIKLNGRVMRTGAASLLSEDTDPTAAVTVFAISDIENLVGMSED